MVLFVSRGHTVKLTDASRLSLREALREILQRKDTRVIYYATDNSVYEVEVSSRGRAGCVARLHDGTMLYGPICLQRLAQYLDTKEGVIEIAQLDAERVRTDLLTVPQSLLPLGVRDIERLISQPAAQPQSLASRAQTAAGHPAPAVAPPAPIPAPGPAAAVATPPPAAVQDYVNMLSRRGIRVVDSFNVLSAAAVAVAGKEVSAAGATRPCLDLVSDLVVLRGRVLMDCLSAGKRLLAHMDAAAGKLELLYSEGESVYAGLRAVEKAIDMKPDEVRVFVLEAVKG